MANKNDSFNRLDLPPYKDLASLSHKLGIAVEETLGFGYVFYFYLAYGEAQADPSKARSEAFVLHQRAKDDKKQRSSSGRA